ncbi:hypothetical protein ACFWMW_24820, partial [Streptomyces sp. NPDC058374]
TEPHTLAIAPGARPAARTRARRPKAVPVPVDQARETIGLTAPRDRPAGVRPRVRDNGPHAFRTPRR